MRTKAKINGFQPITKTESHIERVRKRLIGLAVNITAQDRSEAISHFGFTKSALSKYLSGDVRSLETGIEILAFMKKRIDVRENKINELCEPKINA